MCVRVCAGMRDLFAADLKGNTRKRERESKRESERQLCQTDVIKTTYVREAAPHMCAYLVVGYFKCVFN